ncbi:MAG TPA: Ig domain-containing protein [Lacunisphaera sp.]|nr:Ig domain-containing protein [Lacunisphaera sp.]
MDTPSLTSGRRAIKDPVVENMNVIVNGAPQRYHFIKHGFKVSSKLSKHNREGDDVNLGFDVRRGGPKEGPLDLQLNYPTDAFALAAHILRLTVGSRVEYFGISEDSWPEERLMPVRGSVTCLQLLNPFFAGLLSADLGDTLQTTYSIATMGTTETLDPKPTNHRSGATKAYSATQEDGSALPDGVAINASTGVITLTKADVVAGTYVIKVVATDTLTSLPSNHPWRQLDCEQTLILTITA